MLAPRRRGCAASRDGDPCEKTRIGPDRASRATTPEGGRRVFCPNCGTQNPEAAQTCTKCNFNLKGAAAPKFKGTMLMMNQQGAATPAPPGVPAPVPAPAAPVAGPGQAGGPPRPMMQPAPQNKLKGTMVGVAPPM